MILMLTAPDYCQCDAIRINLLPYKLADDSCSIRDKEEVVRIARQVGSYVVMIKKGMPNKLVNPNRISAILPNA